jgi:hypothetical protein
MDSAMPNMIGPAATEELRRQGFKGVILGCKSHPWQMYLLLTLTLL